MIALGFRQLVDDLSAVILSEIANRDTVLIVGLDGPDCSGKSTLTQALTGNLMKVCSVLPVHFDDFLNTQDYLERCEKPLPRRFREDYFDWFAMRGLLTLLEGRRNDRSKIDVILVEGLFLFERSRFDCFSFRVRLELSPELVLKRALRRDVGVLGNEEWVRSHYQNECIPAQIDYIESARPSEVAHYHVTVQEDFEGVRFSRETPPNSIHRLS